MKDLDPIITIILLFFIVLAVVMTIESNDRGQVIAELLEKNDSLTERLEQAEDNLKPCAIITEFVDLQWLAKNLPTSTAQIARTK